MVPALRDDGGGLAVATLAPVGPQGGGAVGRVVAAGPGVATPAPAVPRSVRYGARVGTFVDGVGTETGYSRCEGEWSRLYYCPEAVGMEVVAECNVAGSYEFDMVVVWRHVGSGALYAAHDAGCSCPTPFEGVGGLDELRRVERLEDLDGLLGMLRPDESSDEIETSDGELLGPARTRTGERPAAAALRARVRAALTAGSVRSGRVPGRRPVD